MGDAGLFRVSGIVTAQQMLLRRPNGPFQRGFGGQRAAGRDNSYAELHIRLGSRRDDLRRQQSWLPSDLAASLVSFWERLQVTTWGPCRVDGQLWFN